MSLLQQCLCFLNVWTQRLGLNSIRNICLAKANTIKLLNIVLSSPVKYTFVLIIEDEKQFEVNVPRRDDGYELIHFIYIVQRI